MSNSNQPLSSADNSREQQKAAIRADIYNVCKANGLPITGDLFFALAFRSLSELRQLARELHIQVAA